MRLQAAYSTARKRRYADSIESLVRNNIQKMKIDMANEVIDAGRFDMQTSMEERKQTLEALLQVWSFMSSQTWVQCTAITDLVTVYSSDRPGDSVQRSMADRDISRLTSKAAAYAQPMHQLQALPFAHLHLMVWPHSSSPAVLPCLSWQS